MQSVQRARPDGACRVLLADDQAIFRAGVARVLGNEDDISVLNQSDTAEQLLEAMSSCRGCVLLVAQSVCGRLQDRLLSTASMTGHRVILMAESSGAPNPLLMRKLDGMLTRQASAAELIACVRRVHGGERSLQSGTPNSDAAGIRMRDQISTREMQIIGCIVQGLKNRQIAELIGTTEQVVKNYLRSIYDKTGASDRLELALFTLHHRALAEAASSAASQMSV